MRWSVWSCEWRHRTVASADDWHTVWFRGASRHLPNDDSTSHAATSSECSVLALFYHTIISVTIIIIPEAAAAESRHVNSTFFFHFTFFSHFNKHLLAQLLFRAKTQESEKENEWYKLSSLHFIAIINLCVYIFFLLQVRFIVIFKKITEQSTARFASKL